MRTSLRGKHIHNLLNRRRTRLQKSETERMFKRSMYRSLQPLIPLTVSPRCRDP